MLELLDDGGRADADGRDAPGTDPPPMPLRWTARRKAEVIQAVRDLRLTPEEACGRYGLSAEELAAWARTLDRHGLGGLKVTRLQAYR